MRLIAGIASIVLFILGFAGTVALQPPHEKGVLRTNPPTPYIHYISRTEPHRRALVVHGLDANKEFMRLFSSALADAGVEVYSIDLPGHGDSAAGFDGLVAASALEQAVANLKPDIAVGHSMGAALLIDLAHDVKFRDLVLISPAPTQVNEPEFQHTLVTTEGGDFPAVNTFASQLEGVELRKFKWGMHSSALVNPLQISEIIAWLGGDPSRLRTNSRLAALGQMFAAALAFAFVLLPSRGATVAARSAFSPTDIFIRFVIAGGISLIVQRFFSIFRAVRLYATDYLVGFILVTGVALLISLRFRKQPIDQGPSKSMAFLKAIGVAAYVIVVLGLLTGSYLIHMTLSDGRWWRFTAIAAASFPLFLFDEIAIRDTAHLWRNALIGIATRGLLVAWMATGVLLLNRESAFLVLLLPLILLFWIALWFFTTLVRRNILNPAATALFAALVQGWMFAAWFVTV